MFLAVAMPVVACQQLKLDSPPCNATDSMLLQLMRVR